jgi:two-component system cell cycle sensor histidine kinase/response regulator CckA
MGVLGNADIALANLTPEAPAHSSIEKVRTAARRASELANQMLSYSGKGQVIVNPVSLNEVVQEMGHLLGAAVSKATSLSYELAETVPPIEVDVTQLRQVVMNLITNASEALEGKNGTVEVLTGVMECDSACFDDNVVAGDCSEGTYVFLEVSDSGIGMDEETLSKMFDPFFTTKFTGRGLGLAAMFGIVRGHGGAIKVASEPGRGTTIRVLFPVTDKPAESLRGQDEAEADSVGGTILLVDDEPMVLDVGSLFLEMAGYEVLKARDGVEAVKLFKEHSLDIACVILDMTMPKMDGEETFVELHKISSDVRVILSSGYSAGDLKDRIPTKRLAGFISKPYTMDQLKTSIAKALSV